MTTVTEPIRTPWVAAPSPLSAKKSMKTKITPAMTKSTSQSGPGMMPTAP